MPTLKVSKDLFDFFYPVGSYYETDNVNWTPQNAGWHGTWVEDTGGRMFVAKDSTSDFNTIGKTGGSKYLQKHNHTFSGSSGNAGAHSHYLVFNTPSGSGITISRNGSTYEVLNLTGWEWTTHGSKSNVYTNSTGNHTHSISGSIGNTGDGNSGNLPPYIVGRRWHRTA